MATKVLKSIKGRRIRITRLDECGNPVVGGCSSVVTNGFISVTLSNELETGEEYQQKNAYGEFCINEKDPDLIKWVNVGVEMCEISPDVLDIVSGANPVVIDEDTIGATFSSDPPTGAYAVEVWTRKTGQDACGEGGEPEWGYFIVPFIRNGKVDGDFTIANAPMTLTLTGEGVGASGAWGVGPYGDNPLLAVTGFPTGDLWGMVVTSVQPPAPSEGCQPVYSLQGDQGEIEPFDQFPPDGDVTAEDAANAGDLIDNGYVVSGDFDDPWTDGQHFRVGEFRFYWDGTDWQPGIAP